jgi:hypothetical protein
MQHARMISFVVCLATLLMANASQVKADLNSPDYVKAKTLFENNKFKEAAAALITYENEDSDWLSIHEHIKEQIDSVITFCDNPEANSQSLHIRAGPPGSSTHTHSNQPLTRPTLP